MSKPTDFSSEGILVLTGIITGTLAVMVLTILPGLVGMFKQAYGFNNAELGYLSSTSLAGMTLGSALSARLVHSVGIRKGTIVGLLAAATANVGATFSIGFWSLLAGLFFAGFGGGVLVTVCYVVLGRSRNTERNFSYYIICQLVLGAAALRWLPSLPPGIALHGAFAFLAVSFAATLCLARYVPSDDDRPLRSGGARAPLVAWIGLAASFVYFIAIGAVWAYFEVIGEAAGVSQQAVASGLAVSSLVALLGPISVAILGTRFGRATPYFIGICIALVSLFLLYSSLTSARFVCAACLFNVSWNFCTPYQQATVAIADPSGRVIGWTASASLAGFAIGPLIAAFALNRTGFPGVLWVSATFCILSFAGLTPIWATQNSSIAGGFPLGSVTRK